MQQALVLQVAQRAVAHRLEVLAQRQVVVTLLAVPRLSVELLTLVDHPLQVEALTSEVRLTQAAVQLLAGHRPRAEAPLVAGRLWGLRSRRCQPAWESCLSLP